jgi:hypothetical protein
MLEETITRNISKMSCSDIELELTNLEDVFAETLKDNLVFDALTHLYRHLRIRR